MLTELIKKRYLPENFKAPDFLLSPTKLGGDKEWRHLLASCRARDTYNAEFHVRRVYNKFVGFSILTEELADALAAQLSGKHVLDLGCGTGYITHALTCRGIHAVGLDTHEGIYHCLGDPGPFEFCNEMLYKSDATTADLTAADVVLMSWPDYRETMATKVATAMKTGQLLYYCGGGRSGCTAEDDFFDLLDSDFEYLRGESEELQRHYLSFNSIHDSWSVYRKVRP